MTSVEIDSDKCVASGACVDEAPEVFDQDDDGTVVLIPGDLTEERIGDARRAAASCPAGVIRLLEGQSSDGSR